MGVDDLLFTIIIGGLVLSFAYLRAQYMMRRRDRLAELGSQLRLRKLYATRPNLQDPLKGPPASRVTVREVSPNAVLARSLPVHVRFQYREHPASAAPDEGPFRRHEGQELHI
jgi:hypothetical protein